MTAIITKYEVIAAARGEIENETDQMVYLYSALLGGTGDCGRYCLGQPEL